MERAPILTFDFHATGDITRVVILSYATFQSIAVFFAMPKKCNLTCRLLKASATIILSK